MGSASIWDVAIIGAGLAGVSAATVLSRQGVRVVLVDPRETYPACFKAEKIEPDQAELFRKFDLLDGLLPFTGRIHEVVRARGGRRLQPLRLEQYGIFYQDMVNGVRAQLPESVTWIRDRVRDVSLGSDVSRLTLMSGDTLATRVVVLANGTGGHLHENLGIRKRMISESHSFALGFNIERADGIPFSFEAFTYYPEGYDTRVAFLTLFPIRDVMRANFFVYRLPGEVWVRRFTKEPEAQLLGSLPKLARFIGSFRITSRIEMSPVDLYRVEDHVRPGLVLLADAYQSVCPTTGTGVSKVLTDVDVLGECLPEWLKTSGMGTDKISQYYTHPRKVACDAQSLRSATYCRSLSTEPSYKWRIYRELMYFKGMLVA